MRTEDLLLAWDPLGYGTGAYGPEHEAIRVGLTDVTSSDALDGLIRRVFLEAFDECPSKAETREMAERLWHAASSCER